MPIVVVEPERVSSSRKSTFENTEECKALQKEEFQVIQSIYPEYVSIHKPDGTVRLEIPVEFGSPRSINIRAKLPLDTGHPIPRSDTGEESVSLAILPPIVVRLNVPSSYPLYTPPKIVSIKAIHEWFPNVTALQDALLRMWEPQECVLYRWIEYMQSREFLEDMHLLSLDGRVLIPSTSSASALALLLSMYDQSFQSAQFSQNSYPCSVCLTQVKGNKCLQLECKHIFCRACLEDFWEMCIAEGNVDRVGCPDPVCVKEGRKASEEDLARVVSESELQRWKWLSKKQALERDPTMLNCPISTCQSLVPKPAGVDPESGWDRFRQCSQCSFSFCSFCKYTWHGPISPCPVAHTQRLVLEYLETEEGSPTRALLEARYGQTIVRRLVKQYEEDRATQSWISSSTTTCPRCESNIEKSEGCNHMTCTRCRGHFCYRCGAKLEASDPYAHFSLTGTRCYGKLFDWVHDEDEIQQ